MWATWPEILKHYAKHYKTGEPILVALLDKVDAAAKFNQGLQDCRISSPPIAIDQAWHQPASPARCPTPPAWYDFEAAATARKAGLDFVCVPVLSLPHHVLFAYLRGRLFRGLLFLLFGARHWMPIRSTGSKPTVGSHGPTATDSAKNCSPGVAAARRSICSAISQAANPTSALCSFAAGSIFTGKNNPSVPDDFLTEPTATKGVRYVK